MTLLLRIAERVINRPLLVHPDKVPLILGVLEGRIPLGDVAELRARADAEIDALPEAAQRVMRGPLPGASRFVGSPIDEDPSGKKTLLPYRRTADGLAVVTITGSLINRGAWVGSSSGETSYEGIKYQVTAAAADPKVKAILLDIESPGGEAVGAFEAAAAVRDAARAKPVTAVVNGMAASAAYAIASAATRIVTTPTGVAGSIGVVMLHADYSRRLDKAGITPTLIFAGAHKVDGNPFEPLTEGVRADLQAEVNQFYDLFVQTVAAGRKALSPAAIRATQARVFIGEAAVEAGLADEVGTFESALADAGRRLTGGTTPRRTTMTNEERIVAITGSPEAKGREALAKHLAESTDMAVEAAIAVLKASPAAAAAPATPPAPAAPPDPAAAASARIAAIVRSPEGMANVQLAQHLAFNTSQSAEEAIATLKASADPAKAYAQRKADAGALGLVPAQAPQGSAAASWKDSVAKVNARITDPAAVSGR